MSTSAPSAVIRFNFSTLTGGDLDNGDDRLMPHLGLKLRLIAGAQLSTD